MAREQERHIRERAHALWEQEGKPHGRDQEHWFQAQRELEGGSKERKPRARGRAAGAKAKGEAATTGDGSTAAKSARKAANASTGAAAGAAAKPTGDSGAGAGRAGKAGTSNTGTAGGKKTRRSS